MFFPQVFDYFLWFLLLVSNSIYSIFLQGSKGYGKQFSGSCFGSGGILFEAFPAPNISVQASVQDISFLGCSVQRKKRNSSAVLK